MELLPIIKASLGIFTFLMSVTFIVSFIVYKIKNRHSTKPYERKPIIFDSGPILEVHDSTVETLNKNSFNKKFEVLNNYTSGNQTKRIIRKDSYQSSGNALILENPANYSNPKISKRSPNEVFNIYSFYSNNELRPMHKLKVKTLTAE